MDGRRTRWSGSLATRGVDERGATPLEWLMVAALLIASVVLVVSLGASWAGDLV